MTQYVIDSERRNWAEDWLLTIYDDVLNEIFEREVPDKKKEI